MTHPKQRQNGQVLVLVAVVLLALVGSAALVLLVGSFEWQRNQLQQLADQAALDSSLKIGIGCTAGSANTVITEADNFVATQRTRTGTLSIAAATCATPYTGSDTFGSLRETIHYPYRAHQQQVEVILTLSLPISFGSTFGATNTTVTARAVGQQLTGSVPAVSAGTLACTGGQFNVDGTVMAQSTITLSGSCAVYAHTRYDSPSGTYSDLGNVSDYTDAQTWVGALGSCAAGAKSGSRNAICADGYELSGHITTTCGTSGTSALLSVGDAAINANPCSVGTAPQPVAPRSTTLPPEPNTDAAAIRTLPGSTACSPAASYPNLVVGGRIVGTAEIGTPAPTKDANGFYHFKPSCYGYLNAGPLAGGISNVQVGPETAATHFIVIPISVSTRAGDLLVANLSAQDGVNSITGPAGWIQAATSTQSGEGRDDIWYYPNNPGGVTSAMFTVLPASVDVVAQMSEWKGVVAASPLDQAGTKAIGTATTSATVATSAGMAQANELVITNDGYKISAGQTFTPGTGWTSLVADTLNGFSSEYRLNLPAGVASETVTTSQASQWSLAIATFKPANTAVGPVLDPGFYYFNGSGFAGGGGICLNGGALLAHDVTLEFVNQAGFSSGTCMAGGGASCTGACEFGSTPCSIQTCPPNAALDSPNNLSWFAAPCSQAPAGDASCPGSTWCPVGDRSCWNTLIWAPASSTGQIALVGAANNHWLLGSVFWPGACTDTVNGTSTIAGSLACGTLSVSAAAGAGTAVGGNYGISTALVEAVLVE
jgi:hypothetical protein